VFEGRVTDPLMQSAPTMAHLSLAVALDVAAKRGFGDLTTGRPGRSTSNCCRIGRLRICEMPTCMARPRVARRSSKINERESLHEIDPDRDDDFRPLLRCAHCMLLELCITPPQAQSSRLGAGRGRAIPLTDNRYRAALKSCKSVASSRDRLHPLCVQRTWWVCGVLNRCRGDSYDASRPGRRHRTRASLRHIAGPNRVQDGVADCAHRILVLAQH
jgi:hypothetical protein